MGSCRLMIPLPYCSFVLAHPTPHGSACASPHLSDPDNSSPQTEGQSQGSSYTYLTILSGLKLCNISYATNRLIDFVQLFMTGS